MRITTSFHEGFGQRVTEFASTAVRLIAGLKFSGTGNDIRGLSRFLETARTAHHTTGQS